MKMKLILISMGLLLGGTVVHAEDMTLTNSSPKWYDSSSSQLYRKYELTLEGFGFATVDEHTLNHLSGHRVHRDAQIGLGAGLEFFFNRYIGVEAEGFSESTHHSFIDTAGGNLVLRLPIGESGFAPYIFGGGGHQSDPADAAYADGGAGLEYRFTRCFGLFTDARYMFVNKTGNYAMGRLGVHFTF